MNFSQESCQLDQSAILETERKSALSAESRLPFANEDSTQLPVYNTNGPYRWIKLSVSKFSSTLMKLIYPEMNFIQNSEADNDVATTK